MALLEGKDPRKRVADTYGDILKANWMVWPVVQGVNFRFVPAEGRLLFVNFFSLGEFFFLIFDFSFFALSLF